MQSNGSSKCGPWAGLRCARQRLPASVAASWYRPWHGLCINFGSVGQFRGNDCPVNLQGLTIFIITRRMSPCFIAPY